MEQAEYAIVSLAPTGRILTWNQAAQKMWGLSHSETYGEEFGELIDRDQQSLLCHLLDEVQGQGIPRRAELRYSNCRGEMGDLVATFSPLLSSEGKANGVSIIARDVTDQKVLEKELARIDRLDLAGQMAAGIGHEIGRASCRERV